MFILLLFQYFVYITDSYSKNIRQKEEYNDLYSCIQMAHRNRVLQTFDAESDQ